MSASSKLRGPHRRLFDEWARFYDAAWLQLSTYRPVHDAVLGALGRLPVRRALDVGCGTGQLAARLAQSHPKTRVSGCDFSAAMLRRAARHSNRVAWVRGDALRLPFRSAAFDVVVSTEAFHWFPDQEAVIGELFRLLRPGGRLLLGLVTPRTAFLSEAAHRVSRLAGEPFYWPTAALLRRRLQEGGFRVRSQRRIFRLPGVVFFPATLTVAERPPGRRARRRS